MPRTELPGLASLGSSTEAVLSKMYAEILHLKATVANQGRTIETIVDEIQKHSNTPKRRRR